MKLGIVGLPNVGKSTLFNSLTKAGAESANYPFCTIDPNVGVVTVPDERLNLLGDFYKSKKVTPVFTGRQRGTENRSAQKLPKPWNGIIICQLSVSPDHG